MSSAECRLRLARPTPQGASGETAVLGTRRQRALADGRSCGPDIAPEHPSILKSASHCQLQGAVHAHLCVGCAWPGKPLPPPEWLHSSSCSHQSGPQGVVGASPLPEKGLQGACIVFHPAGQSHCPRPPKMHPAGASDGPQDAAHPTHSGSPTCVPWRGWAGSLRCSSAHTCPTAGAAAGACCQSARTRRGAGRPGVPTRPTALAAGTELHRWGWPAELWQPTPRRRGSCFCSSKGARSWCSCMRHWH